MNALAASIKEQGTQDLGTSVDLRYLQAKKPKPIILFFIFLKKKFSFLFFFTSHFFFLETYKQKKINM
jgi:hypothetical protein